MREEKGENGWQVSSEAMLCKEFHPLSHQKRARCGISTIPHPWTSLVLSVKWEFNFYTCFRQVGVQKMWWFKESAMPFPTSSQELWGCKTTVLLLPSPSKSLVYRWEHEKMDRLFCYSYSVFLSRKILSPTLWLSEAVAAAWKINHKTSHMFLNKTYETSLCQLVHSSVHQYPQLQNCWNCPQTKEGKAELLTKCYHWNSVDRGVGVRILQKLIV